MQEEKNPGHHGGFSWWVAAIFIVGETAGSGLVAMPNAIKHTGSFFIPFRQQFVGTSFQADESMEYKTLPSTPFNKAAC
ncbi:unnamed protein product [Cylicostephanus goldi]|uniref:Uncharacterized protein n=1 Tax=Cylicostephanus goldi TaxID=71465 RepID=A0A3P7R7T8_CYLGO|nr:unnamed protein product [Cylicostephanus goldi]